MLSFSKPRKRLQQPLLFLTPLAAILFFILQTTQINPFTSKQHLLLSALSSWHSGPLPRAVSLAASACNTDQATDVLLREVANTAVIDVGANHGQYVTKRALERGAAWVLSIEPDPRTYPIIAAFCPRSDTVYRPVKGAAGEIPQTMPMYFNKQHDQYSCFNCYNAVNKNIFKQDVRVYTLDGLVLDGEAADTNRTVPWRIALLKTDTQGHELSVLRGARRLLASGRVEKVLMEFDLSLLESHETALAAINVLSKANFQCTHLKFAPQTVREFVRSLLNMKPLYTFEDAIDEESAMRFIDFVEAQGERYTDLLCFRSRG